MIYIIAITAFYLNFRNVKPYEEEVAPPPPEGLNES